MELCARPSAPSALIDRSRARGPHWARALAARSRAQDAEGVQPVATSGQSASIAFVRWSATEPGVLGCGSDKGDIYLYSHRKGAKAGLEKQGRGRHPSIVAIPGITHADNQITCGDWLQSGALALASGARVRDMRARGIHASPGAACPSPSRGCMLPGWLG